MNGWINEWMNKWMNEWMDYKEGRILREMKWGVQVCDESGYGRMRMDMREWEGVWNGQEHW